MKKKFGDRKDGTLVRDADAMHVMIPHMFLHRCDNEAFIQEQLDLTAVEAYLAEKNVDAEEKYTVFQICVTAMVKLLFLRPQLNRFIQGRRLYQRNVTSASFVIKKKFSDTGGEGLALLNFSPSDTLDSIHNRITSQISQNRASDSDGTTDSLELLCKLPQCILRPLMGVLRWMDFHGWIPESIAKTDPSYASVFLTNLGSINLNAAYHHLSNWGTNSLFAVIGSKHKTAVFSDDGSYEKRELLDFAITVDERIADGYYFAKSIALLKYLLQNPELLELPLGELVELPQKDSNVTSTLQKG